MLAITCQRSGTVRDKHHILHSRRNWSVSKESRALRASYLYELDRETHEELHRVCPEVPLLGYYALSNVLNDVHPINEPSHDLDELTRAIERSTTHYRVHPIERELGYLAVEAIQLQKNFIVDDLQPKLFVL